MLSGMFDHNQSRVVVDGFEGEWFPNQIGVMQGSSLSPLLYALYIDGLPKMLLSNFPSIPLGNSKLNSILYADDIALVAESVDTMQDMLDYCTKFAKQRHFHWGTQKCEVLLSRIPPLSTPLMLQGDAVKVCNGFKYLGIFFGKKGIDMNACVNRLGGSMEKAAMALAAMGLEPRNYPLHIIANHFGVYVRSCGEYALAILPLSVTQMSRLEKSQYRAIKFLLKTDARVSRVKLLGCLDLETVKLRYNMLSAKWFDSVIHHKDPDSLVNQAWIDYLLRSLKRPQFQSSSSSFHFPYMINPIISRYREYCLSFSFGQESSQSSLNMHNTFSTFCLHYRTNCLQMILGDSRLPIPQTPYSIAKTFYSLGVPRDKLRFVILWLCNYVPYIRWGCNRCGEEITKIHLESCAVRSLLPNAEPGKRIDNLLHTAVNRHHAPSALMAVKILYTEVVRAFPSN